MELQKVFIKCLKPGPRKRYQDAPGQVLFHIFIIVVLTFILALYWLNNVGEDMLNKEVKSSDLKKVDATKILDCLYFYDFQMWSHE